MLTSVGNAAPSGLGDIKGYWRYPQGNHRLGPREYVYFEKQWGFTVDTGHRHVRYVFRTCWHGLGLERATVSHPVGGHDAVHPQSTMTAQ